MELSLWFGDERGYNATFYLELVKVCVLWFGDERGYNATIECPRDPRSGCGLVMKEDITQLILILNITFFCCGLVMKEDITQLILFSPRCLPSCGLVMKEDITQLILFSPRCLPSCGLVMKEDITQPPLATDGSSTVVVW